MKYKNLDLYEQPLESSWHSFLQQQQQEGSAVDDQQQQQQQQDDKVDDPFAGLKLENVDDEVKAVIEKARISHANLTKTHRETAEKLDKVVKVAQSYQSTADKAVAKLREHNLSLDNGVNKAVNPQDQILNSLTQEYIKMGIQEKEAANLARTMLPTIKLMKDSVLSEVGGVLGPALGKIQSINADRYIEAFSSEPSSKIALQLPGVLDEARGIVNLMIQNKQEITQEGVNSAISMALGQAMLKSGGDIETFKKNLGTPKQTQNQPSILQSIFGGMNGGGNHIASGVNQQKGDAPTPANEDTARANLAIIALMDKQTKKN